jgi:hypothetical protein
METDDEPTCGKGIAASADLPDRLSDFMRAMADLFENHIRALDPAEDSGRVETEAYQQLRSSHHDLGGRLEALAASMRGYRNLPMAAHNMDILMDRASSDSFARLVESEKDLLALLQDRVEEHGKMLEAMQQA